VKEKKSKSRRGGKAKKVDEATDAPAAETEPIHAAGIIMK
jgi:large subunit ribosomal protein L17